ncbi:hypothetical protein FSPOR_10405 [Fusarium sporotrichioides]|uniref:F-box domain-containing protein n=1 Tax=Fusarium sporotrichioides TaxID=5514 RepID=A0A395RLR0_FUSSP|nr:hypothetical protein FSPOR_10405 [Fusarium sporotrichioides]
MSTSPLTTFLLADLPMELQLKVYKTMPFRSAAHLIRCSKEMYQLFIEELYKRSKTRGWFPLGFACATNNIRTLSLCLSAGAPIDCHIPKDVSYHRWDNTSYYLVGGWRPLREAMYRLHVEATKFLLQRGADPNMTADEEASRDIDQTPLAYIFRRGVEGGQNAIRAREICLALVGAGADLSTLSAEKGREIDRMRNEQGYLPAQWS